MVKTRIAPSPTGEDLHIGNAYTALLNYAWAKKNKGKFVIRIEDTDRTRLVQGSEDKILNSLKWLGLNYDEGPYRQSDRLEIYKKYAAELTTKGAAYRCFCSKERLEELRKKQIAEKKVPRYDKHCLNVGDKELGVKGQFVVRLKVPDEKEIAFSDVIRGEIKFSSNDIDDQVLLKSDGYPTYHLAVVVDDHEMEISHVIRGEEWISSTPKHVLIYQALGWELPVYAHTPLLRNADKSKLSKRKNPVWVAWYREQGFLPTAILNYLALMGWSHPQEKETFSLDEFVKVFDLADMQPVGPVFDPVKLEWMNGMYVRKLGTKELGAKIQEFVGEKYDANIVEKTIPLIQERIKRLSDYLPLCEFFFEKPRNYEIDLSSKKNLLNKIRENLDDVSENQWKSKEIGDRLQKLAEKEGIKPGEFFMTLRVAMAGKKITPPLNESMEILGKDECLKRISYVVNELTS